MPNNRHGFNNSMQNSSRSTTFPTNSSFVKSKSPNLVFAIWTLVIYFCKKVVLNRFPNYSSNTRDTLPYFFSTLFDVLPSFFSNICDVLASFFDTRDDCSHTYLSFKEYILMKKKSINKYI